MIKKILLLIIALLTAVCFAGCDLISVIQTAAPAEKLFDGGVTPAPGDSDFSPEATVQPEPTPEPTPETTSEPTPEPTPELTEDERFSLLAPIVGMSFEELVGDNGIYDTPQAFPAAGTYKLVVDLYWQVVIAYSCDKNGDYTVPVRYMLCSSGKKGNATGTLNMGDHKVRFGKFVNDGVYGQYWSNINGRIYFHSILYKKRSAGSYTDSYKKLGKRASHGCIRLTVPDARWIYYNAAPGTQCEIRAGSKDDAETGRIKERLTLAEYPKSRAKLSPGNIPDTDNWSIAELNAELISSGILAPPSESAGPETSPLEP